jgi:hypothetical protein
MFQELPLTDAGHPQLPYDIDLVEAHYMVSAVLLTTGRWELSVMVVPNCDCPARWLPLASLPAGNSLGKSPLSALLHAAALLTVDGEAGDALG